MNHTETLTRYIANFVQELANSGLQHVVISPGSRSTPLALTFTEHNLIQEWVIIDERSAAFFALGLAKATQKPVALVCTSGTAVANYFPAIIEAYHSRVPLLVLTADRPPELRDVDAPQAISQLNIYGTYAKWFHEMALPEANEGMLNYVRSKASRAYFTALHDKGAVHLNFPLREPLVPDFSLHNIWGSKKPDSFYPLTQTHRMLGESSIDHLKDILSSDQKGLVVIGPEQDAKVAEAVVGLANVFHLPVLVDPLSQARVGQFAKSNVIETYDALFKNDERRRSLKPDYIIRFGAMPVSKTYRFYIEDHADATQYIVTDSLHYREPTGNATNFIHANPVELIGEICKKQGQIEKEHPWLKQWQVMNVKAKNVLALDETQSLTEGDVVLIMTELLPKDSYLFTGNSMAVRDLDTFMMASNKLFTVLANRGANGIDGVVSSAVGAAATGKQVTLLIGDLSFYHDLNGLLAAKHYHLPITVILVNNDGGGIFSFLPQSNERKHFEKIFGTPLGIDFRHAVHLYDGVYTLAKSREQFKEALKKSYIEKRLSVIEIQTNRNENVNWHRQKWEHVERVLRTLE